MLSPKDFFQHKVGICWDFVGAESYYFKKYFKYKFDTYYVILEGDKNKGTHTFLIYQDKGKYYYFESSWQMYQGIKPFNSLEEIFDFVIKNMIEETNRYNHTKNIDYSPIKIFKYECNNNQYGMSCAEFMNYIDDNGVLLSINGNADINPIMNKKGWLSPDGIWNSIEWINNEAFRNRVEVLVLNDKKEVFLYIKDHTTQYNIKYTIPGGSPEENKTSEQQVYEECKEEARIIIKNIKDTGITYSSNFNKQYPKWQVEKLHPYGLKYEGAITHVYIADYDKHYNGHISKFDKDGDMCNYGKFYKISDVIHILSDDHKKALSEYIDIKVIQESSFNKIDTTLSNIVQYKKIYPNLKHVKTGTNYEGLLFLDNNNFVGIVQYDKVKKYIVALEVAPDYRNKGVATELIQYALNNGIDKLSVNKSNTNAIKLYNKLGYKVFDSTDTMFFMQK